MSYVRGFAFNTYNAAGVSRRQDQNVTNLVQNVNNLEFGYYIWNSYMYPKSKHAWYWFINS